MFLREQIIIEDLDVGNLLLKVMSQSYADRVFPVALIEFRYAITLNSTFLHLHLTLSSCSITFTTREP